MCDVICERKKNSKEKIFVGLKLFFPFLETLRCYPPFSMLRRIAVKDYTVPGTTNQIISKGTPIIIPGFQLFILLLSILSKLTEVYRNL